MHHTLSITHAEAEFYQKQQCCGNCRGPLKPMNLVFERTSTSRISSPGYRFFDCRCNIIGCYKSCWSEFLCEGSRGRGRRQGQAVPRSFLFDRANLSGPIDFLVPAVQQGLKTKIDPTRKTQRGKRPPGKRRLKCMFRCEHGFFRNFSKFLKI